MKKYGEVMVPKKTLISHTCDICKKDVKPKDSFDVSYTTIEMQKAECYPGYTSGMKYRIDVCTDCFEDKIIPLIEEKLGVEFQEEELG